MVAQEFRDLEAKLGLTVRSDRLVTQSGIDGGAGQVSVLFGRSELRKPRRTFLS
jgi:hypothetical protein